MSSESRMQWKGRLESLFTSFGFTIGLGNIWRFPYMCYTNGGGIFLIPYLLAVVLCTLPMLFLKMSLGQFSSGGPIKAWRLSPLFMGIGLVIIYILVMNSVYYITIIMYAFYYMLVSLVSIGGPLPWQFCRKEDTWSTDRCRSLPRPDMQSMSGDRDKIAALLKLMETSCVDDQFDKIKPALGATIKTITDLQLDFFKANFSACEISFRSPEEEYWNRHVLGAHESNGLDGLVHVNGRNAFLLFILCLIVYYCCIRGIRSIAKAIYITATFPFGLLVVLLVRGVTLSGYEIGLEYYAQPNWQKILDLQIWASAFTQAFYSIALAHAHLALSSHNPFQNNVMRDAIIIGIVDTATSVVCGFVVFSFIGHASIKLGQPIDHILDDGPGILFISYIQGITLLPNAAVWSFLFFLMVFTLGLDSQFVTVWTLFASLEDVYPKFFKRFKLIIMAGMCTFGFLLGLPLVTKGGIHMVVLMDTYTSAFTLTVFILLESVVVCYVYGINKFVADVEMMIGNQPRLVWWYWKVTWAVTSPALCIFICIASAINYKKSSYNGLEIPEWGEAIGLMIIIAPFVIFLGTTAFQIRRFGGITKALLPASSWGPELKENRTGRYADDGYITVT